MLATPYRAAADEEKGVVIDSRLVDKVSQVLVRPIKNDTEQFVRLDVVIMC
jgi:hypothetical protein